MLVGCLGNTPLRTGLPCATDADCKGPSFQLYCAANRLCKAETCAPSTSRKCFTGPSGCDEDGSNCRGVCEAGTQSCVNGYWSLCKDQKIAADETCDGKDNNCDGKVDETFPEQNTTCEFKNSADQKLGAGSVFTCEGGQLKCEINDFVVVLSKDKSFSMGTSTSDKSRKSDEPPTYTVDFKYNYSIGQGEVTQKDFKELMGYNPSVNNDTSKSEDDKPVNNINWHEAAAYTVLLSKKNGLTACFDCTPEPEEGKMEGMKDKVVCTVAGTFTGEAQQYVTDCPGFRLPTEAEWLNAYRAGENYRSYYNGNQTPPSEEKRDACYAESKLDSIGWYCNQKGDQPNAVKQKEPNRWQLYDLSGNVAEWVFDIYSATFEGTSLNRVGPPTKTQDEPRVVKGGSYDSTPTDCRGSRRDRLEPSKRKATLGFRLARTIQ